MLVPDLGQQRTARRSQDSPPFGYSSRRRCRKPPFCTVDVQILKHSHQSMTGCRPARPDAEEERISASEAPLGTHPDRRANDKSNAGLEPTAASPRQIFVGSAAAYTCLKNH